MGILETKLKGVFGEVSEDRQGESIVLLNLGRKKEKLLKTTWLKFPESHPGPQKGYGSNL